MYALLKNVGAAFVFNYYVTGKAGTTIGRAHG